MKVKINNAADANLVASTHLEKFYCLGGKTVTSGTSRIGANPKCNIAVLFGS